MKENKGFTLIELLVTVVIFAFIIGLAAYSFRFYAGIVKKIIMPYPEEAVNFSKLQNAIESSFYFIGERKNDFGKSKFFLYFNGSPEKMEFISSKPILENGLAVCKLYSKDGKLIWEESPVYSKYDNYKIPKITDKKKQLILMNNISNFHITYYTNNTNSGSDFITEKMPRLIKISLSQNGKQWSFYFKIESDFNTKENIIRYMYEPF